MRILFYFIIFHLTIFCSAPDCRAQKDFKSSSWNTISGQENFHNAEDFSGQIKLYSTGEKIIIEADIKDEFVHVTDNFFTSDRIDLWLSIKDNPEDTLFTTTIDSLSGYAKELYFLSNPNSGNKGKVNVNFGTVHYMLTPSASQKIILSERSNYDWIAKSTGEKPGQIENGVIVKSEISKQGYKLSISITPLALGFIKLPRMESIKFRFQITDMDKNNLYSVHSLSSENKYLTVEFSKSLYTNVTSIPTFIYDSLVFHPILMFNSKNFWSGVSFTETSLDSSGTIKKIAIRRAPVGYKKWQENHIETIKLIRHLNYFQHKDSSLPIKAKTEEFYFSNGKMLQSYRPDHVIEWQFKGLQHEFVYQDNFPGLLIIQITDTSCINSNIKTFRIVKIKNGRFIELFKIREDPCKNLTSIGSLTIADLKIEKIYWVKEGISLMVESRIPTKGDMKFRIGFQGDNAIITPVKK